MCTNFTPTQRAQWVKEKFGVELPAGYPPESYPGFAAPLIIGAEQHEAWLSADPAQAAQLMRWQHMSELVALPKPRH